MSERANYSTRKSHRKPVSFDRIRHSYVFGFKNHGGPRKGGHGKFAEGRPGDELNIDDDVGSAAFDPSDPNYDPEYDPSVTLVEVPMERFVSSITDFQNFKDGIREALQDYIDGDDEKVFMEKLKTLKMPIYHQELPYVIIKRALDFSETDRRRTSHLLNSLKNRGEVTEPQFAQSFRKLRAHLDDYLQDCPNANQIIEQFLDDSIVHGNLDKDAVASLAVPRLSDEERRSGKEKISTILKGFYNDWDCKVAADAFAKLDPQLHADVIKRVVSTAFDKTPKERERASRLIAALVGDVVKTNDAELGFTQLLEQVEDLYLDVRDVLHQLALFIARAVVDEALPPSFLVRQDLGRTDMGFMVVELAQKLIQQNKLNDFLSNCWSLHDEEEGDDAGEEEENYDDVDGHGEAEEEA